MPCSGLEICAINQTGTGPVRPSDSPPETMDKHG